MNLIEEVVNGIINYSGFGIVKDIIILEGVVVKVSDKMVYLNYDIDDLIRVGLLRKEDLFKDIVRILGDNLIERLNILIKDFIKILNFNINNGIKEVGLSKEINEVMIEFRKYMFKNIYLGNILKVERNKVKFILL